MYKLYELEDRIRTEVPKIERFKMLPTKEEYIKYLE